MYNHLEEQKEEPISDSQIESENNMGVNEE